MWRTRRRAAALAQALVFLSLPFLEVGGESALRFDIPGLKLHVFGAVLWIDQFQLVLFGTVFALLFAVAATVVLGRIWCGWVCPQTVIPELSAWISSFLPPRWEAAGRRLLLLPLSALVSMSLLWYFLPPAEAAAGLLRSKTVQSFFLVQWAILFAMLDFAGPAFCRTVCPYSMLQNGLFDRDTLVIEFDRDRRAECLRCDLCFLVCPVAIDIKKGLTRECIACTECIDACGLMTEPRGIRPFIGYRGRVARGKALLLALATAAAGIVFFAEWALQPPAAFAVQWTGKGPGTASNMYRYSARNNLREPLELVLALEGEGVISGEEKIRLGPHSRTSGEVTVRRKEGSGSPVTFVVSGPGVLLRRGAGFP